jgi:glutamyl-tRNA synthetase
LALLSWGAGDDATVLTTAELIERFTLDRVSHKPARFDEVKLKWLNGVHIRELSVEELTRRLEAFTGREQLGAAVRISQEKLHTLADFWPLSGFLFDGPQDDPVAREKWLGEDGRAVLRDVRAALAEVAEFDEPGVREVLEGVLERRACKPRMVYQPLRVAISGTTISPGIFESVALLGRDETLRRIDRVL